MNLPNENEFESSLFLIGVSIDESEELLIGNHFMREVIIK
jgi:hypothetical protein